MNGTKKWYISDGYYPTESNGPYPSHEAVCVLNPGMEDANIEITLYFEEKNKIDGFHVVCKAERTSHIRMDRLKNVNGESIPSGIPYAILVRSDVDIIVQYSRMDTSQAEMALMTTMGFAAG